VDRFEANTPMDRLAMPPLRWHGNGSESVVVMGASNLAARRAAKANRRKAIVAQKRKAEAVESTPAGQAIHAAALPIRHCLMTETLFETGIGTLILARGSTVGRLAIAGFLLDSYCRGVKDVMFRTMDVGELAPYLDMLRETTPLVSVDPSYARKLLRDLTRWSASLGFPPPRNFAAVERLFGTVDPQACDVAFELGMGGKPLYVSGPGESVSVAHQHVERLQEQLGPDNFHYVVGS
jgi:hypothetical protein